MVSQAQGCSGVGTRGNGVPIPFFCCGNAFPHLFVLVTLLEDVGSKRLHWNMAAISQMRTFALLVKSLQRDRKIQCGNSCRRMLTLFELFRLVFLCIWCGNGVPAPVFVALHPWSSTRLEPFFPIHPSTPRTALSQSLRFNLTFVNTKLMTVFSSLLCTGA